MCKRLRKNTFYDWTSKYDLKRLFYLRPNCLLRLIFCHPGSNWGLLLSECGLLLQLFPFTLLKLFSNTFKTCGLFKLRETSFS